MLSIFYLYIYLSIYLYNMETKVRGNISLSVYRFEERFPVSTCPCAALQVDVRTALVVAAAVAVVVAVAVAVAVAVVAAVVAVLQKLDCCLEFAYCF